MAARESVRLLVGRNATEDALSQGDLQAVIKVSRVSYVSIESGSSFQEDGSCFHCFVVQIRQLLARQLRR